MIRAAIYAGLLAMVIAAFGYTYHAGYSSAEAKCDAEVLRSKLKKTSDELAKANAQAIINAAITESLRVKAEATNGKVDELAVELAKRDAELIAERDKPVEPVYSEPVNGHCVVPQAPRPSGSYRASDSDIERLRRIPD